MLNKDLTKRKVSAEEMDSPDLSEEELFKALNELEFLNKISFTAAKLEREILLYSKRTNKRTISILELACGSGWLLRELSKRLEKKGIKLRGLGLDINSLSINLARSKSPENLRFEELDLLHQALPTGYDVVICTLFLHHLERDDLECLLQKVKELAPSLFLVSDLKRSFLGLILAFLVTRMFCRSSIVKNDSIKSVKAALTRDEMREVCRLAGLGSGTIANQFPQRLMFKYEATW